MNILLNVCILQVSKLLAEWCQIRDQFGVNDATCAIYVIQLHRNVFSIADDMPERFLRLLLVILTTLVLCPLLDLARWVGHVGWVNGFGLKWVIF